jgi:peptidyl-prolyl cis-trans isomerase C
MQTSDQLGGRESAPMTEMESAHEHSRGANEVIEIPAAGQGCGSSSCGCNSSTNAVSGPAPSSGSATLMEGIDYGGTAAAVTASVNGVAITAENEIIDAVTLRQRACTELLRQAAIGAGVLDSSDRTTVGVLSESASIAIEQHLDAALAVPVPSEAACERYYAANLAKFREGEAAHVRHILFAVTPGVDVVALRLRAEKALLDVRCHDASAPDRFSEEARRWSNCPSAEEGGALGWLTRADCAPEFGSEIFGRDEIGVLPRLVHSRFGLHVVEVLARNPGAVRSFDTVRGAVESALRAQSFATALRQYVQVLAGDAVLIGVDLEAATSALVQ